MTMLTVVGKLSLQENRSLISLFGRLCRYFTSYHMGDIVAGVIVGKIAMSYLRRSEKKKSMSISVSHCS